MQSFSKGDVILKKLVIADIVLLFLSKLSKVPAAFKKEDKIDNQPYQTSAEYAQENNRKAVTQGDPNRMNIFKD